MRSCCKDTGIPEIEAERALVSASRELAERMEGRIAAAVGRVWYDWAELPVN